MNDTDINKTRFELERVCPECHVKVAEDQREMVAEISEDFAVAIIERSLPHFHLKMKEVYRVLSGTLYVACRGQRNVMREGEAIAIEPRQIHFARCAGEPAWIEVESSPPWSADDHFVL